MVNRYAETYLNYMHGERMTFKSPTIAGSDRSIEHQYGDVEFDLINHQIPVQYLPSRHGSERDDAEWSDLI